MPARVMPRTPTDRRIPLAEVYNLRDLGGYACAGGRQVNWRMVYRADGLHRAQGADLEVVRGLGLRTVVDLRTSEEVARGRLAVAEIGAERFHHLPLMSSLEETLGPGPGVDPETALAESYLRMLDEGAPAVALALRVLADPAAHPVVFHGAAGKDRTGVLAALLLSLLGVDEAAIAEDYAMSAPAVERMVNHYLSAAASGGTEVPVIPEWLLSAPPGAITRTLAEIVRTYGSVPDFARSIGVTEDTLERLVRLLTGPAEAPTGAAAGAAAGAGTSPRSRSWRPARPDWVF